MTRPATTTSRQGTGAARPPAERDESEEQRMPPAATPERFISRQYEPDLAAPRKARGHVRAALSSWGLEAHADAAETVISELVTNAVSHGEGPAGAQIWYDGRYLHLEVHDDGPGRPVWHLPGTWDESGRGLMVIASLIGAWGSFDVADDVTGEGKTVHVTICAGKPAKFSGVRAGAKDAPVSPPATAGQRRLPVPRPAVLRHGEGSDATTPPWVRRETGTLAPVMRTKP